MTGRSPARLARYRPMRMIGAAGIEVPLRTILSRLDGITPAALHVMKHDCVVFPGAHLERRGEHLPQVLRLTVEWFTKHLAVEQPDARTQALSDA